MRAMAIAPAPCDLQVVTRPRTQRFAIGLLNARRQCLIVELSDWRMRAGGEGARGAVSPRRGSRRGRRDGRRDRAGRGCARCGRPPQPRLLDSGRPPGEVVDTEGQEVAGAGRLPPAPQLALEHRDGVARAQPERAHARGVFQAPHFLESEKAPVEAGGPLRVFHPQGDVVDGGSGAGAGETWLMRHSIPWLSRNPGGRTRWGRAYTADWFLQD